MRRKLLSLFIVSVLCIMTIAPSASAISASVTAAESSRATGVIRVEGNVGAARSENVLALITDASINASAFTPGNFGGTDAPVYALRQDISRDDGEFEIELRLGDSHLETKNYKAIIITASGLQASRVFEYKSYYQIPYALGEMSGYTEAEAAAFYGKYDSNAVDFASESENVQEYYNGFDGAKKTAWATIMIKIRPENGYIDSGWTADNTKVGEGLTKFNELFKKAEYLTQLNSLTSADPSGDVDSFLNNNAVKTKLEIDAKYYTNVLAASQGNDNARLAARTAIVSADPKPATPAELNKLIEEALAVEEFQNVSSKTDCGNLMSSYSKVFTVADTEEGNYATMLAALVAEGEKPSVIETMFANKAAGESSFTTKENIIAAYKKAISEEYTKVFGDSGSGDGGLGDGGSGDDGSDDGGSITIGGGGAVTPDVDENKEKMTFIDLGSYGWAKDAIYSLVDDGVLSGFGDGTFRPGEKVTREQFVTMLVNRYQKANKADITKFADVKAGAWYYDYVAIGVGSGMVYGLSDTEFGVGKPITRQDLAVMAYRAMGSQYVATGNIALRDIDSVAGYARTAVEALYEMGIVSGDENGNFRPADNATRAEAARILYLLK